MAVLPKINLGFQMEKSTHHRKRGFSLAKRKWQTKHVGSEVLTSPKKREKMANESEIIDMITPTPTPKTIKSKLMVFLLYIFLKFGVILCGVVAFVFYDYFIAIITIMLAFIIVGIIRSKLRNSSIPPQQQEYQYNDKEIAQWFIANHYYN